MNGLVPEIKEEVSDLLVLVRGLFKDNKTQDKDQADLSAKVDVIKARLAITMWAVGVAIAGLIGAAIKLAFF